MSVPALDALSPDDEPAAPIRLEHEEAFGRYRLCYELGSGGMATVYLARVEGPGGFAKAVAIKRIHPHLAKRQDFVGMFLDEARVVSLINHPNVCTAFDFGEVRGTYYLAMEYLVGEPLAVLERVVVQERPQLLDDPAWQALALDVLAAACDGLHAAHEARDERGAPLGLVHRDVSPQNVFVSYDGAVKLMDFGIALSANRMTHTRTGTLKGKVAYMAPEQLEGGGDVDRRADLWSIGVCAWELLVGSRLFRRPTELDTMLAIREGSIAAPSSRRPSLGAQIDAVVLRALSRDRNGRQPTARDLARELRACAAKRRALATRTLELAEFMAELFRDRRPGKLEIVETLMRSSVVARSRPGGAPSPHPDADAPTRLGIPAPADVEAESSAPPPTRAAAPAAAPKAGRTVPVAWVIAVGVPICLVLGGAIALLVAGTGASEPSSLRPPPPVAAPARALEPPRVADVLQSPAPVPPAPAPAAPPPEPEPEPEQPAQPRPSSPARSRPTHRPVVRAPAAPLSSGYVTIVTPGGWADIYLGGRYVHRTPYRLALPVGRHVVELRPSGSGAPVRRTVDVSEDANARLTVPLP